MACETITVSHCNNFGFSSSLNVIYGLLITGDYGLPFLIGIGVRSNNMADKDIVPLILV